MPGSVMTTKEIGSRLLIPGKLKFELLTGIKSRHVCQEGEDSFTLAVEAARECLKHSRYGAEEIDAVFSCSITKYKNGLTQIYEPPLSLFIKEAIGARHALHFDVSNACAGMLTGVYMADTLIRQGEIRNCLIVSGEYISSLIENALRNIKTPLSSELASLTVGDAGAAVILETTSDPDAGISLAGFSSLTQYNDLCTARPQRGFPGASMKTKAKRIHEVSIKESVPILEAALKSFGLEYRDIDFLIPHQTSRSAIIAGSKIYADFFGGHPGEVLINVSENGNTASTTHFLALVKLLEEKRLKPDSRVVLISYASGIVVGVALFQPKKLVENYGS